MKTLISHLYSIHSKITPTKWNKSKSIWIFSSTLQFFFKVHKAYFPDKYILKHIIINPISWFCWIEQKYSQRRGERGEGGGGGGGIQSKEGKNIIGLEWKTSNIPIFIQIKQMDILIFHPYSIYFKIAPTK